MLWTVFLNRLFGTMKQGVLADQYCALGAASSWEVVWALGSEFLTQQVLTQHPERQGSDNHQLSAALHLIFWKITNIGRGNYLWALRRIV